MIFVLGFAASAFAIHAEIPSETTATVAKGSTQITLGGEIRVRGEVQKNLDFNDETNAGDAGYYDQRVRLSLNAKVTPNTMGHVMLETGGGSDISDTYTWGYNTAGANGATGVYARGNSKRDDLRINEAWILHKGSGLLGIPAGLKIGHMPLALGNKLFFDHTKYGDDAIVFFMDPSKDLHIGVLTAKFSEGLNAAAASRSLCLDAAGAYYTVSGSTCGDNDADGVVDTNVGATSSATATASTASANDADGYVALFTYKASKDASFSGDITYVNDQNNLLGGETDGIGGGMDVHFWNFGLRGDMNISGLGIKADVELQTGKISDADMKFRGYAALVGLTYTLDPVKLSLDWAYGSGDNDADNKFETFVSSLGRDQHYTYVYEYRATSASGGLSTGLANTMYVKLGADFGIMKDLNGSLSAYWLRAAKKMVNDSRSIGTEIDAKVSYKIDRNLNYWVEGGYLFAGSFYDTAAKTSDNAYAVRHGIQLSF